MLATNIQPLLFTQDVAALRDFYESLGFTQHRAYIHEGDLNWMSMVFQGATIMIQHVDRLVEPRKSDVELYFVCDEVDGLYQTWKRRGIEVTEPKTRFYNFKQMYVRDPDGRVICFESEVKS